MKACVLTLDGMRFVSSASLTEIVVKSGDKLINEVAGVRTAVIGQMIDGCCCSMSVVILKFCVEVCVLANITCMFTSGAGLVTNLANEHGSTIVI